MRIYLIHHGETAMTAQGACPGSMDERLSQEGRQKLMPLFLYGGWIYVSPLSRARETASICFPYARQVVVEDLRERNMGDYEGRTPEEMKNEPDYLAWRQSDCLSRCPNGEGAEQYTSRVCKAFSTLVDMALRRGDKELFIMAHGTTQAVITGNYVYPDKAEGSLMLPCGEAFELSTERWNEEKRLTIQGFAGFTSGPCYLYSLP